MRRRGVPPVAGGRPRSCLVVARGRDLSLVSSGGDDDDDTARHPAATTGDLPWRTRPRPSRPSSTRPPSSTAARSANVDNHRAAFHDRRRHQQRHARGAPSPPTGTWPTSPAGSVAGSTSNAAPASDTDPVRAGAAGDVPRARFARLPRHRASSTTSPGRHPRLRRGRPRPLGLRLVTADECSVRNQQTVLAVGEGFLGRTFHAATAIATAAPPQREREYGSTPLLDSSHSPHRRPGAGDHRSGDHRRGPPSTAPREPPSASPTRGRPPASCRPGRGSR